MTNVSQLDIEQIEGLIRSIKGMNDDNYQDTWVAILERGTLDKNEIERVAKNIVAEAIQNAKHERCKLVHLAIEKMDLKIANPIYKPRRRLIFRYIDIKCVHCGSYEVAKYGCYKGIQRYYCFTCSRKFRDGMNLKKHYREIIVNFAKSASIAKRTLNQISTEITNNFAVNPSISTIWRWLNE